MISGVLQEWRIKNQHNFMCNENTVKRLHLRNDFDNFGRTKFPLASPSPFVLWQNEDCILLVNRKIHTQRLSHEFWFFPQSSSSASIHHFQHTSTLYALRTIAHGSHQNEPQYVLVCVCCWLHRILTQSRHRCGAFRTNFNGVLKRNDIFSLVTIIHGEMQCVCCIRCTFQANK